MGVSLKAASQSRIEPYEHPMAFLELGPLNKVPSESRKQGSENACLGFRGFGALRVWLWV